MSADLKVRGGATVWKPDTDASPLGEHGPTGLPAQPTRRPFPAELCNEQIDADRFIGTQSFNFLADTLAKGQLPNFSGVWKAGYVFVVEDITTSLMSEAVRTALAAEVSRRSGGRTSLALATEDEVNREGLKGRLHLAIERDGDRSLFGFHDHGVEPHTRKG